MGGTRIWLDNSEIFDRGIGGEDSQVCFMEYSNRSDWFPVVREQYILFPENEKKVDGKPNSVFSPIFERSFCHSERNKNFVIVRRSSGIGYRWHHRNDLLIWYNLPKLENRRKRRPLVWEPRYRGTLAFYPSLIRLGRTSTLTWTCTAWGFSSYRFTPVLVSFYLAFSPEPQLALRLFSFL